MKARRIAIVHLAFDGGDGVFDPKNLFGKTPDAMFLPPYNPNLNPIERVFTKLKHMMRKAGERTFENTWRRAGALLDLFSPAECQNYLSNAGYASI